MKTAEKLAAGWLITLGFMFMTVSVSAAIEKNTMQKPIPIGLEDYEYVNTQALPVLDMTVKQGVIFGLPTTVLGVWLALSLYHQGRRETKAIQQQMSDRLQSVFYRMLQESNGRVTLLKFAMQSELPPLEARKFLDQRAKEFNANFKVNEDGGVSYHFDV